MDKKEKKKKKDFNWYLVNWWQFGANKAGVTKKKVWEEID